MRKLFKMDYLNLSEQDDALLQMWRTYEFVQKQGKDIPDMWKTNLPLIPLRLARKKWGTPYSRMSEWIGYKAARMLSDKYRERRSEKNRIDWYTADDQSCEGWYTAEGYPITRRLHLPLEKDAPHYGNMYRLDDICQYMDEVYPKLGSLLDGEVIKDLYSNSPVMGVLEPGPHDTIKRVGQATMEAILDCINDIGRQACGLTGHGFAIMPEVVAEMVMSAENLRMDENFETDVRKGTGTIYWGNSSQVALYSHSDLTDKIVVGFKPDDVDQASYIFRPYSFGIFPGPDVEGHDYYGKMQLILRYMKRLVGGGCGLYGVIQYSPQPQQKEIDIREVLAANPLRDCKLVYYLRGRYKKITIPQVNQTFPEL